MFVETKTDGETRTEIEPRIKLSAAIRIGARLSGKACGFFVDEIGNTCAQGAALLAVGMLDKDFIKCHRNMEKLWPDANLAIVSEIAARNNNMGQTREEIADWLEAQGY